MLLKRKFIKKPRKNLIILIFPLILKASAIISLIIIKLFKNNATANLDPAGKKIINSEFLNLNSEIPAPAKFFIFLLIITILNILAFTPFIAIISNKS